MTKDYQAKRFDTSTLAVPERVSVAMGDIAEDMREGLLALAVGAGLQVMGALMDADVSALAGPRGRHDPGRVAVRHGTEAGSVTLGGRRVGVRRPRMRAVDGTGELKVPAYELLGQPCPGIRSGVSTRSRAVLLRHADGNHSSSAEGQGLLGAGPPCWLSPPSLLVYRNL